MAAAVLTSACKTTPDDVDNGIYYTFEAKPNTNDPWEWVYVSFANATAVHGDDAKGRDPELKWDVAVLTRQAEIALRTNSGTSGNGGVGGLVVNGALVPDAVHPIQYMAQVMENGKPVIVDGKPKFGITQRNDVSWSGHHAVEIKGLPAPEGTDLGSYNVGALMPPVYEMAEPVIVRSADGLHDFHVSFVGYRNDAGTAGYPTMRFEVVK